MTLDVPAAPTAGARRWTQDLGNVSVAVDCGGARHVVRLHRGQLVLVDHVIAAEAAVMAFGGKPPPCFEVLRSWRARSAWERALEPRGPGFHQLYRRPPLPPELQLPLECGVIRSWERRRARGDRDATRAIDTAITTQAATALAAALRLALLQAGGGPVERCTIEVARAGAAPSRPPSVSGFMTRASTSVTVRLQDDWWRTVGRPGLTDGAGRFVAACHPEPLVVDWRERSPGRWAPQLVVASR